jgi:nucleoside-diphosphate-sugar epimerase
MISSPAALVTGVAGFLGSHLAELLLERGYGVTGVDCFTPYYSRRLKEANLSGLRGHPRFQFHEADLVRHDLRAFVEGRSWIFHQAAQPGVRASWDSGFTSYVENNLLATHRLLEASRRAEVSAFVFASSSSVYGNVPEGRVGEDAPLRPLSPYGVSKLASEELVQVYHREFSLPTVCLRYFTVCGPRQRPDMAFHRILRALHSGEEFPLNGNGGQERDFTYVSDAVEANLLAAERGRPGGVYNIGGGTPRSLRTAMTLLEEFTGKTLRVRELVRADGDPMRTAADLTRAERDLGYSPRVPLEAALREEARWFSGPQGPLAIERDG